MPPNDTVHKVTERIRILRTACIQRMARAADAGPARADLSANACDIGCELFAALRSTVGPAETGAAVVV